MLIFITYMIKVGISLAFFYVLYKLLLSKDANHKYKRQTLLLSVCAAFAMPLLAHLMPANEISSTPIQKVRELIEMPLLETAIISPNQKQTLAETSGSIPINRAIIVYWSILSMLCIRFLISYQSIFKWLRKATIKPYKDILLAIVNDAIQAFSFLNYIVLSKQDYEQNKTPIILHEEAHIRLHHSFDVVLIELVCYLQWFNPFAWLLKKELKLVHEYQADKAVLNTGIDATQYQLLILEKAVGKRRFASANHFKQGSISKRLKMMKNKQVKRWGVAKALLFLPMGLLLLQAFTQPEIIKKVNELSPLIIQQYKTEAWLQKWTINNIQNLNTISDGLIIEGISDQKKENYLQPRNAMSILQNRNDNYLVQNELTNKADIEIILINFIQGKGFKKIPPPEVTKIKLANGKTAIVNKGVIMYQYDRATTISKVEFTIRSIGKAFLKVRMDKSQELFDKDYFSLNKAQRLEVDERVPIRVNFPKQRVTTAQVIIEKGGVYLNGLVCPINNLSDRIKDYMRKNKSLKTISLTVAVGIPQKTVDTVKDQLKLTGISKLNYSTAKH